MNYIKHKHVKRHFPAKTALQQNEWAKFAFVDVQDIERTKQCRQSNEPQKPYNDYKIAYLTDDASILKQNQNTRNKLSMYVFERTEST